MKFTLYWLSGRTEVVEGTDIADAVRKAGYGGGALRALDYYQKGDTTTQVAGMAPCGCVHGAEDGEACEHDLERAGLPSQG